MKIIEPQKSTFRLSPSVSLPLSSIPSNRFYKASLAFFNLIEENETSFIVEV